MAALRTRSITAKVTPEQYARLEALAGPQKISMWAHDVLLRASAPDSSDRAILAEVIALRMIVVNLHFTIAGGQPVTAETMRVLIERADHEKGIKAAERLATMRGGVA